VFEFHSCLVVLFIEVLIFPVNLELMRFGLSPLQPFVDVGGTLDLVV